MKNKAMESGAFYHQPVLRAEAIDALNIDPAGVYVDATFGGGGHSQAILEKISDGRLIGFDQDEDAQRNIPEDARFKLIPENFRYIGRFLRVENVLPVSGIIADLGVSSYQFDTAERGFSIRMDAPLDMRMDRRQALTAADVLQKYSEDKLWKVLETYGEVRNAKTLAGHLVKMRHQFPLNSVGELKTLMTPYIMGNERRYLAQVFQALRIEVNDEMGALKELLEQAADSLRPGGRLVVITFHSIEDRIVKQFMKKGCLPASENSHSESKPRMKPLFKKPVLPTKEEMKQNARAASAKMRAAERV